VFAQYLPTCLAVPILRRTQPGNPRAFRLPFGPLVPAAATIGCLLFLNGMKREDLRFALLTLLGGVAVFAALRWSRLAVPGKAR
jgi:amino acid transporter